MKILIYLHHPAHFHLFRNLINVLKHNNHKVTIFATKKDILTDLLDEEGFQYHNNLPYGRKDNKIAMALSILKQDFDLLKFCLYNRPDIMLGTSAEICHVGKLLNIPAIMTNEDDYDVILLAAKISYPYAKYIIAPNVCSVGKWETKKISYKGYHELAYIHPNNFTPSKSIIENYINVNKPYFILRFAKLNAHHDQGKSGITTDIAEKLVNLLLKQGNVYITSERKLEGQFEKFRISLPPTKIHHALAFADIYIGDSQTMAAEAGVLGTPFIRFNDFVGKIGYLNELELKYKLGYGFNTSQENDMLEKLKELLCMDDLKQTWKKSRQKMLADKIDVTAFLVWFVENYPVSAKIMKENPDYQYKFK